MKCLYTRVKHHIDSFWMIVNAIFDGIWDFISRGQLIRRSAYVLMWVLTWEAYHWCFKAAELAKWDAATIGALFGILTPVSLLQAAVFKFYSDSRKEHVKITNSVAKTTCPTCNRSNEYEQ